MALWDLAGKAAGLPVHRLLGGAVHREVDYFAFPQGDTVEELAAASRRAADEGYGVVYIKIGRGERFDMEAAAAVRDAIGDRLLRLDANGAWDTATAIRMIRRLRVF